MGALHPFFIVIFGRKIKGGVEVARFCPLFSGSSGNSIYVGTSESGVLIDVGMNAKQTTLALERVGIDPQSIKAIFITHEHSDHIRGLKVFASRNGAQVFTSKGTLEALNDSGILNGKFKASEIESGVEVDGMQITAFNTPHDSRESVGYIITLPDGRKAGIVTDLGVVTEEVMSAITGCDLVLIESNHDIKMLQNGAYPYYLKRRILSEIGHLSNDGCAQAVTQLIKTGTTRFVLGHLSRENNIPQLAYQNTYSALTEVGAKEGQDFLLSVAPRDNQSKITIF